MSVTDWSGSTLPITYVPMLTAVGAGWTLGEFLPPQQQSTRTAVQPTIREVETQIPGGPSLDIVNREALLIEQFRRLAAEWRDATQFQSSLARSTNHPAYQAIIELGAEIIPVLLHELRRQPEPWFVALREITGVDPVAPTQRGNMQAMAAAWLRWGRDNGLIR